MEELEVRAEPQTANPGEVPVPVPVSPEPLVEPRERGEDIVGGQADPINPILEGGVLEPADPAIGVAMVEPRRSQRERTPRICTLPCCNVAKCAEHEQVCIPSTPEDALSGPDASEWWAAMQTELNLMQKMGTWEVVKRPEGMKVIGSRWVFTVKRDNQGSLVRRKARLVAQGFSQVYGVDFDETSSPVVLKRSLHTIFALALEMDWEIDQVDVISAYLHSPLDHEVYMSQAPLCHEKDPVRFVYKLKKSVYGLRQSGKNWYEYLCGVMSQNGFCRCQYDPCVFAGEGVIVAVHVDDMVVVGPKCNVDKFKVNLSNCIDIKDLGTINNILQLHVSRPERERLEISQPQYIDFVLHEFNINECKGVQTPMGTNVNDCNDPGCVEPFDETLYRRAIGCLLYLANNSRPDILNVVCRLSQYLCKPRVVHWQSAKRVMKYLKFTRNYVLHFKKSGSCVTAYCDSDFSSDVDHSKSFSGHVVFIGNTPVIWKSKKQECVASSSGQAEYIAMYSLLTDLAWLDEFLLEIGFSHFIQKPIRVFSDSNTAIAIASSVKVSDGNKHIRNKFHFVREQVKEGFVSFKYVNTNCNIADVFTKPLPSPQLLSHCRSLGIF